MGSVKQINDEQHFQDALQEAISKLVVADFTASWCHPCQKMAPIFKQLAAKYFRAVFLKIDVDQCRETAVAQGVSSMPSFMFYRNLTKVDYLEGADPLALESKIVQYYSIEENTEDFDD